MVASRRSNDHKSKAAQEPPSRRASAFGRAEPGLDSPQLRRRLTSTDVTRFGDIWKWHDLELTCRSEPRLAVLMAR